jgi:hypothetical protein
LINPFSRCFFMYFLTTLSSSGLILRKSYVRGSSASAFNLILWLYSSLYFRRVLEAFFKKTSTNYRNSISKTSIGSGSGWICFFICLFISFIVIVNISALGTVDSRSNAVILTGSILCRAALTSLSLLFYVMIVVVLLFRVFSTLIRCRGRETAGVILGRLRIFVIYSSFSNDFSSFDYSLVLDSSF